MEGGRREEYREEGRGKKKEGKTDRIGKGRRKEVGWKREWEEEGIRMEGRGKEVRWKRGGSGRRMREGGE